jgi:hypothetical protein
MIRSMPDTASDPRVVRGEVHHDGPTITELVSELRHETTELFRKEVELARLEVTSTMTRLQTGVSSMALGGVVAFAGLPFLLAAAAFGLDRVLHAPWLSTLIVGAVAILLGVVLLAMGKARLDHLAPKRTLESLRHDTELLQEHLPGGGS